MNNKDLPSKLKELAKNRRHVDKIDDEITHAMESAGYHLEMEIRRANIAEDCIEEAIKNVPWIDHPGNGDPPKGTPDYVQVLFRDGDTMLGIRWDWDENWEWSHHDTSNDGDIIAYRFLQKK